MSSRDILIGTDRQGKGGGVKDDQIIYCRIQC